MRHGIREGLRRRARRWMMPAQVLTLVFCSAGLASPRTVTPEAPGSAGVRFEEYEIVLGSAERQVVAPAFLLDGAFADFAVVHVDENDDRRLRIYAFDDATWTPMLEATLRPGVTFLDVANIGGRDRLVTYERGRLSWFDPDSSTERPLVTVVSSFHPPRANEIPHVDVTRDLNGDGRDDLVVPAVDGFQVFVQTEGGTFANPVKVGASTDLSRIYGADGYRYDPWSQSRVHEVDYDHDGRRDLVFWNEGRFEVHIQDERGRFDPAAERFTTEVAFDSDDLDFLAGGDMTGRVLHTIGDLNGDGVADLVVHSLQGKRISDKRSAYEVYFGARARGGGTSFASEVGVTFHSEGRVLLGMERRDFDGDDQIDLMLTSIRVESLRDSLWKRLKGFMGDDVGLHLDFYRMVGGKFRDQPDATYGIALDGVPSHRERGSVPLDLALRGATHEARRTQKIWPRAFNPTLRFGDVNGDGRLDVLKSDHPRMMEVLVGVPAPGLLAGRSQSVSVALPNDEEYTRLLDLDRDGKADIFMHHPFTLRDGHGTRLRPPGTEPHRVTMLIAR